MHREHCKHANQETKLTHYLLLQISHLNDVNKYIYLDRALDLTLLMVELNKVRFAQVVVSVGTSLSLCESSFTLPIARHIGCCYSGEFVTASNGRHIDFYL